MIFVDATDQHAVVEDGPVVGVGSGREACGAKGEGHSNLISCIWGPSRKPLHHQIPELADARIVSDPTRRFEAPDSSPWGHRAPCRRAGDTIQPPAAYSRRQLFAKSAMASTRVVA
jgi:hypothetical protein